MPRHPTKEKPPEKFKKGLDYLTQAMPIFVAAEKTEEAEAEPPTEG